MAKPGSAKGIVDNIVIGSGLAALAAAKALRARGAHFEVVDVGRDLEPDRAETAEALSHQPPAAWPDAERQWLFPVPATTLHGVERRRAFGSDFPYVWPRQFSAHLEACETEFSFALGGLANVWGAAVLPYGSAALRGWPIDASDLAQSYRNVLSYVPVSGEADELQHAFPLYTEQMTTLERSRQTDRLFSVLDSRREALEQDGITFGRARLAVDSSAGSSGCRYCGYCLDGCVYGALFSPRPLWRALEREGVRVNKGWFVQTVEEEGEHVTVAATQKDGAKRQWRARRVYLAAGQFGTTSLIARSMGLFETPIRIRDSQYFHFPLFSYRSVREDIRFTLAEAFIEILNPHIADEHVHLQVYGRNRIFSDALRTVLPWPLPVAPLANRLYLFQGYLPSSESDHLELTVHRGTEAQDRITLKGISNARAMPTAQRVKRLIASHFRGFGFCPPGSLSLVSPGRSFHSGGSFPMGGPNPVYSSDVLGRPAGLERVHIVDAANFPHIASSTIGLTIMANADRIARAGAGLH